MLSTKNFQWNPKTKTLSAEDSELRGIIGRQFDVQSEHTGKVLTFKQSKVIKDRDGDISWWEYTNPINDVKIIIWND